MKKFDFRFLLLLLFFIDLSFSFVQHYHKQLDGDMASIVLGYPEVMSDPLGLNVLLEHQVYGGTNRFFAHWMMSGYFKHMPLFLQNFASPIESIYLSCSLAKTIIQLIIVFTLAYMISGAKRIWNQNFLLNAILVAPLFQTNGYNGYMGIISSSITYTFFYAMPLALLLLFILPFYNRLTSTWRNMSIPACIIVVFASIVLALGGPLSAPIILIGSTIVIFSLWIKQFDKNLSSSTLKSVFSAFLKIPRQLIILLTSICLICLYSIYLGQYNAENFFHHIPISERFKLLPKGLYFSFTQKLGLPLLLSFMLLNLLIIKRQLKNDKGKNILRQAKWIAVFALAYILILPFGGYREYRPNIVRVDTLLPVIMCIIYIFSKSTLNIILNTKSSLSRYYSISVVMLLLVFVIADKSITRESECEQNALEKIAQSPEKSVPIDNNCTVMSWSKITDCNNSKLNCELLRRWGVIKDEKCYFQN